MMKGGRMCYLNICHPGDFLGGPVVQALHVHAGGMGSIPGRGAKIPRAKWHDQKKKKNLNATLA